MLKPFMDQIMEYKSSEVAEVTSIVGIDGSPSCGVNFTHEGNWRGEFSTNKKLEDMLHNGKMTEGEGVFMREFRRLLEEAKLQVPIVSLSAQVDLMKD